LISQQSRVHCPYDDREQLDIESKHGQERYEIQDHQETPSDSADPEADPDEMENLSEGASGSFEANPNVRRETPVVIPTSRTKPKESNATSVGYAKIDVDSRNQKTMKLLSMNWVNSIILLPPSGVLLDSVRLVWIAAGTGIDPSSNRERSSATDHETGFACPFVPEIVWTSSSVQASTGPFPHGHSSTFLATCYEGHRGAWLLQVSTG
jgi:hypothetical protein